MPGEIVCTRCGRMQLSAPGDHHPTCPDVVEAPPESPSAWAAGYAAGWDACQALLPPEALQHARDRVAHAVKVARREWVGLPAALELLTRLERELQRQRLLDLATRSPAPTGVGIPPRPTRRSW